jgi:hypothetical protein
MKMTHPTRGLCFLLCLAILLSACNMPQSNNSQGDLSVTQAYETVQARLTEVALETPAASPTPTDTPLPTPTEALTPTNTAQPTNPPATVPPASSCDLGAPGNPIDVTIPDDTRMLPGQTFTKTWRLQNAGTCTWSTTYSIALFSGEAMGAPASVPMPKSVGPGESVDISVDLVAPQTPGTYQGNWKLRNASNAWFGIGPGGGSPFWVRIVVGSTTGTVTPLTSTPGTPGVPTLTFTPTPGIQTTGRKTLLPGDRLNLDNGNINSGVGEDFAWEMDGGGLLSLTPLGGASFGIYGASAPTLAQCQGTALSAAPLPQGALTKGLYLCYRTELGLYGWLELFSYRDDDKSLVVNFLTWAAQ